MALTWKPFSAWPRAALPLVTLALAAWALTHPAPMLVNLGAGDEPLARGFQEWERAGPEGRTMFRWTRDGARIEVPAVIHADRLQLRVRLARFMPTPVELTWRIDGRDAFRQTVAPRGWHVETLDLGPVHGPLALDVRSFADPDGLGAAIDWIELRGAQRVAPQTRALVGLLGLVILLPMATGLIAGTGAGNALGVALLVAVPALLWHDPAQGLVTIVKAGPAAFVALCVLAAVSRFRSGEFQPAFAGSAIAATLACLLLLHPSFFYPDVDTHARLLWSIRQEPSLAIDPSPYQQRTGAWTRGIGGEKVAFPYSPAFHVAAWPFARLFGDTDAIKLLAAVSFGASVLLVHVLARALGLPVAGAMIAQAVFGTMPVQSSRLFLALFPALFAQALELTLLRALLTRLPALDGRALATLGAMMLATQLAYTGSLVNVAAVIGMLVLLLWTSGERRAATRLAALAAATTLVVAALLYARFLPVLWTKVLPHAAVAGETPVEGIWRGAVRRAFHFYGVGLPVLAIAGFWSAGRSRPMARRVLTAAIAAGGVLLLLRGAVPALVRDVKEIELLAGPIAVFAAAGLLWLDDRPKGRPLMLIGAAAVLLRGLHRGAEAWAAGVFVLDH
jgi:hypothetical protein